MAIIDISIIALYILAVSYVFAFIEKKNPNPLLINARKNQNTAFTAQESSLNGASLFGWCKNLLSTFVEQSATRVDIFGAPYGLFVLFSVVNLGIVPIISEAAHEPSIPDAIIYLRILVSGLGFFLIMKDFWPRKLTRYFPLYWHLTLFVCLPFFTITMCIHTSCSIVWIIDLILTNFILGVLVDWKTYFATIFSGFAAAVLAFLFFGDLSQFDPDPKTLPILFYAAFVSLAIGAIYSRSKERAILDKLVTFKALGGTIAHEMRTPLSAIQITANGLKECLPALVEGYERARMAGIEVPKISNLAIESVANTPERMRYICASALNIIDMVLLQLRDRDWSDHFVDSSIKECVDTALSEYCFRQNERDLIDDFGLNDFKFFGNQYLLVHILFNLMRNAFAFIHSEKKGRISIWTSESATENHLHFCDTAKGISKDDMPYVFDHGFSRRSWGSGVGLHYCKKMMETMAGGIKVRSQEGKYAEFVLSFPKPRAAITN